MNHQIYYFLEIALVLIYASLMLFSKGNKNKIFIEYVFLSYPFMAMNLLPSYGYPTMFDLITISFIVLFYQTNERTNFSKKWYQFFIILLILSVLIGTIYAQVNSASTIASMVQYFSIIAFVKIIIDECIFNEKFFNVIISYMRIMVWASLFFLLAQVIIGPELTFAKSINQNIFQGEVFRYPSYFQDPQKYAQFLSACFFISIVPTKKEGIVKWINFLLPILIISALLFTGGRAAFLGLLSGLVIVVLLGMPQYRIGIIGVFIALFLIASNFSQKIPMFNRTSTVDESYEFRASVWSDAIDIWKEHPYFGIGIGNYAGYVAVHNPDQYWIADNEITIFDHPENGYLKLLTEFGIVGFVALFACIIYPVYMGISYFFKTKDITTLILIAALISWLVGFVTVYSLGDVRIAILIGSILALLIVRPINDIENYYE